MGMSDEDERTIVDLLTDQIEFANVIVVNKCDLVEPAEVERLEGILRHLNPDARRVRTTRGQIYMTDTCGRHRIYVIQSMRGYRVVGSAVTVIF
jgi:G3E family GTPase